MTTGRRRFMVKAGGALAALTAGSMVAAPNVIAQPKIQWRMSTTWTPVIDVLQGAAQRLATVVEEVSGGRLRIEVVPGGQIMPLFACFDAASQGTIEAFMGSGQYWSDREPALELLTTIPFGMNPEGMRAWYYQGEGLKLCEETYAAFNLVPHNIASHRPAQQCRRSRQHILRKRRRRRGHQLKLPLLNDGCNRPPIWFRHRMLECRGIQHHHIRVLRRLSSHRVDAVAEHQPCRFATGRGSNRLRKRKARKTRAPQRLPIMFSDD